MQPRDAAAAAIGQFVSLAVADPAGGVDLGPRADNGQDLFADAGRRGFSAQILRFTLRWIKDFVYMGAREFVPYINNLYLGCAGGFMA
jgi:hypothetical protein